MSRRLSISLAVLGILAFIAVLMLRLTESPHQAVCRLLQELRDFSQQKWHHGRKYEEIESEFDRLGSKALPGLLDGLNNPNLTIRSLSAKQLGTLGDTRAITYLMKVAENDPDRQVRGWAIDALGRLRSHEAVPILIKITNDESQQLRFQSALALGRIGDKAGFPALLTLLSDNELYPRAHAAEALGRLGDRRALPFLISTLDSKEDSWVRSMAARALGELGDQQAETALKKATGDASWRVRDEAMTALEKVRLKG